MSDGDRKERDDAAHRDPASGSEKGHPQPDDGFTPFGARYEEGYEGSPELDATLPEIDATEAIGPDEEGGATLKLGQPAPPTMGMPEIPGVTLGGVLGEGGQGTVYRGRQTYVDRDVAVKVLAAGANASFADRFRREAKLLAGMQHPSVVACYDAGISDCGHCYITMEFIDGPDLAAHIRSAGPLDVRQALELIRDVAGALGYALENGVIHRDVKPQNVLLKPSASDGGGGPGFRPKLADLGLARVTGEEEAQTMLTAPGSVMGTPATMALEQIDDPDSVDHRADIYGLGCVLYHALAGKSAYRGLRPSQVFKKKAQEPAPDIRADVPGIAPGVRKLVRSMMEGDRKKRPQTYPEVIARIDAELAALEPVGSPAVTRNRRGNWLLIASGLAALLTLVIVLSDSPDESQVETEGSSHVMSDRKEGPSARRDLAGPDETDSALAGRPALEAGAEVALFEEWSDLDGLLAGWDRRPPSIWSSYEKINQPQARSAGAVATASRDLPGGSWSLTGEVRVQKIYVNRGDGHRNPMDPHRRRQVPHKRPLNSGDRPAGPTFWGGLRIEFEGDRGLELAAVLSGEDVFAAWSPIQQTTDRWEPGEPLNVQIPKYGRGDWVRFRIDHDDSAVRLWIGSDLMEPLALPLSDLDLAADPTTLTLTAEGTVAWRKFILRGL